MTQNSADGSCNQLSAVTPELPAGVEAEAELLEQFTCIPVLNKATVRPSASGKGVQIMVRGCTCGLD